MISLFLLVIFVLVVSVILTLPAAYQNPVLYVLPLVVFVAFLASINIK